MILKIIIILAAIFAVGVITLLQAKSNLISDIEKNIGKAELQPVSGSAKMSMVVEAVYSAVIPAAKVYFTKSRIQTIAQAVYDRMKEFYVNRSKKD